MKNYPLFTRTQCSGYTLLELITVLSVVSVLAASVMPKAINLHQSAKASAVKGIASTLDNVATLVQSRAILADIADGELKLDGEVIQVIRHFPVAQWGSNFQHLVRSSPIAHGSNGHTTCHEGSFCVLDKLSTIHGVSAFEGEALAIWPKGYSVHDQCLAYYVNTGAESVKLPYSGAITKGC